MRRLAPNTRFGTWCKQQGQLRAVSPMNNLSLAEIQEPPPQTQIWRVRVELFVDHLFVARKLIPAMDLCPCAEPATEPG